MDFKEYLKTQSDFNLAALASKMWPNNSKAANYLSVKLSDNDDSRKFTLADERLARKALKELGIKLVENSKTKVFHTPPKQDTT